MDTFEKQVEHLRRLLGGDPANTQHAQFAIKLISKCQAYKKKALSGNILRETLEDYVNRHQICLAALVSQECYVYLIDVSKGNDSTPEYSHGYWEVYVPPTVQPLPFEG